MDKKILKKHGSGCPIAYALDMFGDRWSLLIIREIMFRGKRTYSDFLQAEEGIASNILVERLKRMESDNIVTKNRDPENRRSFVYCLTQKGRDLAPILLEMVIWSGAYDVAPNATRDVLEKIQLDREGFERELRTDMSKV